VFGPAKYGILPEMVRGTDLPRMNGIIQMTTFLAIILGTWVGGILLDAMHHFLWVAGMISVGIALVGTLTSLLVRRTPVAEPEAPFFWSNLAISPAARTLLRQDAPLRNALWVYSIFWFVAAIFPLMVNWLGREQFLMSNSKTSFLLATVSLGIAAGFVCAGKISGGNINFRLVKIGALGLASCLFLLALPSSFEEENWKHLLGVPGSCVALIFSGFFAGLFALPVQVYLQSRPPQNIKGRVIGAMNLINWIAIVFAAIFFFLSDELLKVMHLPKFSIFGITGLLLLPIAFFYRSDKVSLVAESDNMAG
jgi:acyl-[acyl-carrier-protein]-phospholipid O-acyltransferase/long-chain-fatty-acid--[acyl-carrier-protein] ligase